MGSPETYKVRLKPGAVLKERYRVTGLLGLGGFAAVYEASDLLIDRPVAVKVLNVLGLAHHPQQLEMALERFRREARAAARVAHPNIVTIHDMGITEELSQPFIVMERLYGHDLATELKKNGPMAPARLLPLLVRCLRGLSVGHQQGIIHKDLKPSNLFLNHPGQPHEDIRVVDFGIARLEGVSSDLTGTGQVFGTPQYLAPEYINHQEVTPALDVYQMGLILVEALTGKPVVHSSHPMACLMTHSKGDLPLPIHLLESPLGAVIATALARDPRQRYQDAAQMALALDSLDPATLPAAQASGTHSLRDLSGGVRALSGPIDTPNHPQEPTRTEVRSLAPLQEEASLEPQAPQAPLAPPWPTQITPSQPLQHPARPGAGPLVLMGGAALLLLLISALSIGALAWLNRPAPQAEPTLWTPKPAQPLPAQPEPTPDPAPGPAPAQDPSQAEHREPKQPQAPAQVQEAPAPAALRVRVQVEPAQASLIEGGQDLGQGPLELRFEGPQAEPRRLLVHASGYASQGVTVGPEDAPEITVRLSKLLRQPSAPRPAPREASPRPAPRKPQAAPAPVILD